MTNSDTKKYREPEKENARLKKLVADLSLDHAILKDIAEKNLVARLNGGRLQQRCRRSIASVSAVHAGQYRSARE